MATDYGTLLAFDLNGRSLGAFSGDSRIADPRGLPSIGTKFLKSLPWAEAISRGSSTHAG
jgi:hypothetical protein